MACEVGHDSFANVMEYPIAQVFYLCCYKIDRNKAEAEELKKWKKAH